jgi:hypothetical protein
MSIIADVLIENVAAMRARLEFADDEDGFLPALQCWLANVKEPSDSLIRVITTHVAASRSYRTVAAAGFLIAAGVHTDLLLEYSDSGIGWLLKKAAVVDGTPTGVAVDGLAVLGLVLGHLRHGVQNKSLEAWLLALRKESFQRGVSDPINKVSLEIASALLADEKYLPGDEGAPELSLSLYSRGFLPLERGVIQRLAERLYSKLRTQRLSQYSNEELSMALHAYNWVETNAVASIRELVTIDDLMRLLSRLESSFYRWTWETDKRTPDSEIERWDIQNEYHFQNFLWAVLKPVFPDLKEEEYVHSIGAVQSRIDLLIPSLKVIIEVKYRRRKMTEAVLTREIAEDLGLYRHKRSDWNGIIPVIWDEMPRSDETAHLISGLREMDGILDAFVVTRPARMGRSICSQK